MAGIISPYSQHCRRKSSRITFVFKIMTSVWPLWYCSVSQINTQSTHTDTHGLVVLLMLAHLSSGTRAASLALIIALSFPCKHQPTSPCIPTHSTHQCDKGEEGNGLKKKFKNQKWRGEANRKLGRFNIAKQFTAAYFVIAVHMSQ